MATPKTLIGLAKIGENYNQKFVKGFQINLTSSSQEIS